MRRAINSIISELGWAKGALTSRSYSYFVDLLAYRVLKILPFLATPSLRTITVDELAVYYRRNRGDIQGIREVFMDEAYRLPKSFVPKTVLDVGANIGLTSLYYLTHYPVSQLVAVEPEPSNLRLLYKNLEPYITTGRAVVVSAAAASTNGVSRFAVSRSSNLGHIDSEGGMAVNTVTIDTLLDYFPARAVDLLKLDVEGGEQDLLTADNIQWLDHFNGVIAEFHPLQVEYERLTSTIASWGLRYFPAGSLWPHSMDMFFRSEVIPR